MVVWLIFSLTILLVPLLAQFTRIEPGSTMNPAAVVLSMGAAIFNVIAAYLFFRYRQSASWLRRQMKRKVSLDGVRAGLRHYLPADRIGALEDRELRMVFLLGPATAGLCLNLALTESIAVLGLVGAIAALAPGASIPFALIALLLNALMLPDYERFLTRAAKESDDL